MDSRHQFPTPIPAALHRGFHPRVAGTYLEVLQGEEALRLGLLHPEGCLTSTFFLNTLGLACAPSAMFCFLGVQRHRTRKVRDCFEGSTEQAPAQHGHTAGRVAPGQCPWAGGRRHCPRKRRLHLLPPTATARPTAAWYSPLPRVLGLQVGVCTPAQELDLPCTSGRKLTQGSPCSHLKQM